VNQAVNGVAHVMSGSILAMRPQAKHTLSPVRNGLELDVVKKG
jgi:hypothetical protein